MKRTDHPLPAPGASFEELSAFALAFDGYGWGGGVLQLDFRLEARMRERGTDMLEGETDPDFIRAWMFSQQRGWRWGEGERTEELRESLAWGVEYLRSLESRNAG